MKIQQKVLVDVIVKLGYASRQKLTEVAADEDDDWGAICVKEGLITEEQLRLAQQLCQHIPSDATDKQITDAIVDAHATLDQDLNPSLSHANDSFATTVDSRLLPAERLDTPADTSDPYRTQAAAGDPYQTEAPPPDDPYRTVGSAGPSASSNRSRSIASRFRVIRKHAEGGLGLVSLAQDVDFDRDVAVKEIKERFADIPDSQSRFIFEAEITGRLEHPGVVPVYALGRHPDGRPFYAMRFVTGTSLTESIKQLHDPENVEAFDGRLRSLLGRFESICNTIEYAHSRGIIHRDIKPDNIMLGEYGENLVVDWGLAKPFDAAKESDSRQDDDAERSPVPQSMDGNVVGTPYYMSPEQSRGAADVGPQADVYSLGATLYQLLTGSAPLRDRGFDTIDELFEAVRAGKVQPAKSLRPSIPKPLNAISAAAMHPNTKSRYASARELADDIQRYLSDERVSVVRETPVERMGRWTRKNRSWTYAIAASILVIAGATSVASVITLQALRDTELANTQLAGQLRLANQEQAFDQAIVEEEKRQNQIGLASDQLRFPDALQTQLTDQLDAIEATRREVSEGKPLDEQRRNRLLNGWAGSIEMMLSQPAFTMTLERDTSGEIDRLGKAFRWREGTDFEARMQRLSDRLLSRQKDWRPLEFEGFSSEAFAARDGYWQRKATDFADDWHAQLSDCPQADISLDVQFGQASQNTPVVGIILNARDDSLYQFVVADESYDPLYVDESSPTIADAQQLGQLMMFIVRRDSNGDSILRRRPIAPKWPLRMRASRESATRLIFAVGDTDVIEFEDAFPLSVRAPGKFGLLCPSGATAGLPKLSYRELDLRDGYAPDPIMLGDAKLTAGEINDARAEYRRAPRDVEALFKLALTEQNRNASIQQLQSILDNFSPSGSQDPRLRRWYLNAAIRLISAHMNDPSMRVEVGAILDQLVINDYSMEEVQSLVPRDYLNVFHQILRKTGQRWRMAYLNDYDADTLRKSADLLSDSPAMRRQVIWRLSDAMRCDRADLDGGRTKAIREMRGILDEVADDPNRDALEYTTIINDIVGMYLIGGQIDEAMNLVAPLITGDRSELPISLLPLLGERARILYRQGDPAAAMADLQHLISRIDPTQPQDGIHFAHWSDAHALMGIIHDDAGDSAAAQASWLRGRRRNWHSGVPSPQEMHAISATEMVLEDMHCEVLLSSWTNGYTDEEARKVIENLFGGSGISDTVLKNIILRSQYIPDAWLKKIAESVFAGPRGRKAGRQQVLRQSRLSDRTTYGAKMLLYQGVLLTAFDGEASLKQYPELDEELYDQVTKLIDRFQEGAFQQDEMSFVVKAWSGKEWNSNTFESFAKKLKDEKLGASMAMIFAVQMIKHHGNLDRAQKVLAKYVYPKQSLLPAFTKGFIADTIANGKVEAAE